MGGQLDGNFLPGSLPHKFILIVTSIICFVVNKFLSFSLYLLVKIRTAFHSTHMQPRWLSRFHALANVSNSLLT